MPFDRNKIAATSASVYVCALPILSLLQVSLSRTLSKSPIVSHSTSFPFALGWTPRSTDPDPACQVAVCLLPMSLPIYVAAGEAVATARVLAFLELMLRRNRFDRSRGVYVVNVNLSEGCLPNQSSVGGSIGVRTSKGTHLVGGDVVSARGLLYSEPIGVLVVTAAL